MVNSPIHVMDFRGTYKGGGGPDKTILNSAVQHDFERVDVLVTYLRQPDDKEFQIAEMAKALGIKYLDIIDSSLVDWACIKKLKRMVQREKITLIHSHDDKTLLYSVILKNLVSGLRLMHTCHSHSEYTKESFANLGAYWKFIIRKKIVIWLMRCHNYPILTISENTKQRLVRGGIIPQNICVLYNGVDTDIWHRRHANAILKKELGLCSDQMLVGTVARISYDKDLPTFYAVARKVYEVFPQVKFVIVGDGDGNELFKAQEQVEKLGLQHVIVFTGHRTDLINIYTSFDIFLMTSRTEGLPNTLLEAMALQVPVVSTGVGGVPELVVDRKSGLLHAVGDVTALAESLCNLLKCPELREELAQNARKRVEAVFSFTRRVKLLEDFYEQFSK